VLRPTVSRVTSEFSGVQVWNQGLKYLVFREELMMLSSLQMSTRRTHRHTRIKVMQDRGRRTRVLSFKFPKNSMFLEEGGEEEAGEMLGSRRDEEGRGSGVDWREGISARVHQDWCSECYKRLY